jgi:hypothetical protein
LLLLSSWSFMLTNHSNRIEKQISDIQAKSEEKKMAVSSLPLNTLFPEADFLRYSNCKPTFSRAVKHQHENIAYILSPRVLSSRLSNSGLGYHW